MAGQNRWAGKHFTFVVLECQSLMYELYCNGGLVVESLPPSAGEHQIRVQFNVIN